MVFNAGLVVNLFLVFYSFLYRNTGIKTPMNPFALLNYF